MIRRPPRSTLFPTRRSSDLASGGESGIHGWLKGLDLETGRIVWTAYNIGPDSQVLAKPGTFKPFYDRGTELALTSWPADVRSEEHTLNSSHSQISYAVFCLKKKKSINSKRRAVVLCT